MSINKLKKETQDKQTNDNDIATIIIILKIVCVSG